MLKTGVKKEFLDLFHHDIKSLPLEGSNSLDAFTLKIQNNSFAYNELIEALGNSLHNFALSRIQVEHLVASEKYKTLIDEAKSKFREYTSNEGELGELLLYCLLETHLEAPKILTKLELKTSNNDYVKGADGVHLLKLDESNYQLVFGESKMHADLSGGITKAFKSIKDFLEKGKSTFEVSLVDTNLLKEAYEPASYEILKKILIPSAKDDETYLDHSFGIFLGFNLEVTKDEKKLDNSEFRKTIREKITKFIKETTNSFNYQLKKDHLTGYKFYIYLIPFTDIDKTRKQIIQDLTT